MCKPLRPSTRRRARGAPAAADRRRRPRGAGRLPPRMTETVKGVRAWRTALAAISPSTASASPTRRDADPGVPQGLLEREAALPDGGRVRREPSAPPDAADDGGQRQVVRRPPDHRCVRPSARSPRLCNPRLQGRTYPSETWPNHEEAGWPTDWRTEVPGDPQAELAAPRRAGRRGGGERAATNAAWPGGSVSCGSAERRADHGTTFSRASGSRASWSLASRILNRLTETSGSLRRVIARGLRLGRCDDRRHRRAASACPTNGSRPSSTAATTRHRPRDRRRRPTGVGRHAHWLRWVGPGGVGQW